MRADITCDYCGASIQATEDEQSIECPICHETIFRNVFDEATRCDICRKEAVYDARTRSGQWAHLCENCFRAVGIGLGTGKGQKLIRK
jgi:predicted RNA-binding Zn-ribbon protein involved in translation (DUF1610 family)